MARTPVGSAWPATAVLMYHSVSSVGSGPLRSLAVPPRLLREQLGALVAAGYRLVGLSDAIDLRAAGATGPLVALTFDDGYRDFVTEALPTLAEVCASATLYLAVGHAGGPASWLGARAAQFPPLLDWAALRDVTDAGIEVGNHSLVHHPLDMIAPGQLGREIRESADRLTQRLGRPVRSFCYPHGYHTPAVRAAVVAAGHDNACAIGYRMFQPGDDPLAVPRLQPTPDHTGADLVRLVRGGGARLPAMGKAAAQPGWRIARRVARRVGVRLT
ncbi:MAG TPA: polysaccharide deacetylase family protein [Micromonosporaceae bacterium]|nr:polysaccharide deacetylase family protein [Micromonosporaceae bacterium]